MLQREVPDHINLAAAQIAKHHDKLVILDMGGTDQPISEDLVRLIDYISPNEVELEFLINSVADNAGEENG